MNNASNDNMFVHYKCSSHTKLLTSTPFHRSLSLSLSPSASAVKAMLRVLSTRRSHHGYDQLGKEQQPPPPLLAGEDDHHQPQLKRVSSLPARLSLGTASQPDPPSKQTKKAKASKTHPLFGLFSGRRKAKTTAKPEFSRYLEYVKEGGVWDMNSNTPVIYFK